MPQKPCPQAILIDLAGVLHTGNTPIPGSLAAMRQLRAAGIPLRFLTKTTRSPARTIVEKLTLMRFDIQASELQTAVIATRSLVAARVLRPHYLVHPDIVEEIGPDSTAPDAGAACSGDGKESLFHGNGWSLPGYGCLRDGAGVQRGRQGRDHRQAGAAILRDRAGRVGRVAARGSVDR